MDNSQTLELQIQSKAHEAKASVESLVKSLTNVENTLTNIYLELGSIEKKADSSINKTTISATKGVNQLKQATDKTTSSASKLGNTFKNIFTFAGAKKLTLSALGWANEAIDYSEQLNLFNVVFDNTEKNGKQMFSELGKSATQFQYKLNEVFGTNKTQTLYMQGIFQSMGETVGIDDKHSAIMSETMSKLTFDLASLYNKTESATAEAIRAGVYAGQTKPLRSFGIDVTQMSMQPILNELGIDKQVKNMSQAEKEILRYIATMKQAQIAMGDLANTIESPSNQLKVFKQQLIETKVAFSSLFIGALSSALPYANAFLMVIKEISKALATMFGIELKDFNSGIASQEGIYDGIADSVDDATGSVKELKRQTLGFDEIHNINENNNSGTGTSVSGGIDQRLLDAITGYDNGMDKVRMKATEIRDRIMEWLGFTKEIDPLTGEVSFKLKQGWSNLKLIGGIIGTLIGYKLVKGVSNLITGTGKLSKVLGTGGLYKSLKNLVEYCKIYTSLANGNLLKGIKAGSSAWLEQTSIVSRLGIGLGGLITSSYFAYDAGVALADSSENAGEKIGQLAITMGGATASGALLGSTFGPLGTAIGAAAGAVIGLTSALVGYSEKCNEKKVNASIFDQQGIDIDELVKKYETLFANSTRYSDTLAKLKGKYEEAKTEVENINDEIQEFKNQLDLQDEKISQTQIDELNSKYERLKDTTKKANQASLEYSIALIKTYRDNATESDESTAKQIANIKALALKQEGFDTDYINRAKDLEVQLYKGEIAQDDYNKKIYDLNVEFGKVKTTGFNATGAIDNFNSKLKDIDYSNADKLKDSISGIHDEYTKTIDILNGNKDNIKNHWEPMIQKSQELVTHFEEVITNGRTLSDEEKERYDTAKKQVEEYSTAMETEIKAVDTTIQTIQGSYKGFISTVYADLVSQGASTSKEFKTTLGTIESDLNTLKEVDMSGFGKNLFDGMIKDITLNESQSLGVLYTKFKTYGINAGDEFTKAIAEQAKNSRWNVDVTTNYEEFGKNINRGTLKGTEKSTKEDGTAGGIIAEKSICEAKKILDINSPSKVFEQLGIYTGKGYILGIKDTQNDLVNEIRNMLVMLKQEFNKISFEINISTSVEGSFNSILSKLETFANKFRNGINNLLYGMTTSMNDVYVGNDNKIYYKKMPYVSVPKFSNGGMPEDGLFYANHNELVGKFSNGSTAVANNLQIEKGIEEASYRGYMRAIADSGMFTGQSNEIDVHVHTDEGTVIDRIEQRTKQTGVFPFTIPTP